MQYCMVGKFHGFKISRNDADGFIHYFQGLMNLLVLFSVLLSWPTKGPEI